MADYIEREAFLEQERDQYCEGCARREGKRNGKYVTLYEIGEAPCRACEIDDVLDDVENFPAADVAPVRHGSFGKHTSPFTAPCSECGTSMNTYWHYCPNCGAKMDKDGDGE